MTPFFSGTMSQVLSLTKAGRLTEATALLQGGVTGHRVPREAPQARTDSRVGELLQVDPPVTKTAERVSPDAATAPPSDRGRVHEGSFTAHNHSEASGRLGYRLYIPADARTAMPLVIMLHGCTQSPQDFANGTQMNELADEEGFVVAYPEQTQAANAQKCWNWFRPGDQARDMGEPAMIAGLTREIIANHPVDPARVYVAGLSAGGAAAAIMAAAYPELYAAVGIHSGLACGAARDLPSALAAMQGQSQTRRASSAKAPQYVPTITFHGENDRTVHPSNSRMIHDAAAGDPKLTSLEREAVEGTSDGGRHYRCVKLVDEAGVSWSEHWHVKGGGHAWSGGSSSGSYTDPAGPDASRAFLRFFLQHSLAGQ